MTRWQNKKKCVTTFWPYLWMVETVCVRRHLETIGDTLIRLNLVKNFVFCCHLLMQRNEKGSRKYCEELNCERESHIHIITYFLNQSGVPSSDWRKIAIAASEGVPVVIETLKIKEVFTDSSIGTLLTCLRLCVTWADINQL